MSAQGNANTTGHVAAERTAGVILAGGKARRMGGQDKGLLPLNGKPMVCYIAEALRPQVHSMFVNANRNPDAYSRRTGLPVISDRTDEFAGPLAGMAAAMAYTDLPYLAAVPCDSPLLNNDLVARLYRNINARRADIALAMHAGKLQPVFVLLKCELLDSVTEFLNQGGRKIIDWYYNHAVVEVDFSDSPLMFENINTRQDLLRIGENMRRQEKQTVQPMVKQPQ